MGLSNGEAAMRVAKQMYDLESQNAPAAGMTRVPWDQLDPADQQLKASAIDMLSRTDWIRYLARALIAPE